MGVTTNDTRDCSKFSSVVSTGEEASALGKSASNRLFYSCLNDQVEIRTDYIYPNQDQPYRRRDEGKTEQLCV